LRTQDALTKVDPRVPGFDALCSVTSLSTSPRFRFCWQCGQALSEAPPTTCGHCGRAHFSNPKPCGEALVERNGSVLLIRRASEPWRGQWDIPGGFCDAGEHPLLAAERELREETGLEGQAIAFVGIWIDAYGSPLPDGEQEMTLNACYLVRVPEPVRPTLDPTEATEASWFALASPPDALAFPTHTRLALTAARRLVETAPLPRLLDRPDRGR